MFLVSGKELVIAQCRAGIVGTLPSMNARTSNELANWLDEIRSAVGTAPFGVSLIVTSSNKRLDADLQVCIDKNVPLIITSLSPPDGLANTIRAYGGQHLHDVTTMRHAEKALEQGVSGLILISAGAGGHGGLLNPFAFIAEVRQQFKGPLALGGGIATGSGIAGAIASGADFAYIGTRFINASESLANQRYREMVLGATATEFVNTPLFSGIGANYLAPSIIAAGFDLNTLPKGQRLDDDIPPTHVKAWKDILSAGHGVGATLVQEKTIEIIEDLEQGYYSASARLFS
uniref:Nitronate monooxygenase n=1 Tax=OCS116 cluster bacterium TaxID=2030921 RepID=A0A2A4Z037_9PROT